MSEPPPTGDWSPPAGEGPAVPGYEILGELGRGGMGVVYRARDIASGRAVAVKMIRDAALAGPLELARFRVEAEAAARVRHPNVVEVLAVGEAGGRPYLVLELVEGGSLAGFAGGRPQPAGFAAGLVRTLARAVAHAHSLKIVHRDLKPANVLLHGGEELVPKITDFGLAKRLDADATAWTRDGAILGTAGYMAPEQARGEAGSVGPAADVYALGVILYELLVGHPPFHGDTPARTAHRVVHDDPPSPTRLRPDVPPDLETVCLKCLEKEPDRRYESAGALADDLDRFLDARPVAVVPTDPAERLIRRAARDGYHLLATVGRGPRSVVYRARFDPLGQTVAVKVFPGCGWTREAWDGRLRDGAGLGAVLAHPQVVPVRGAGWWDDTPYLVTEYAPHGNLCGPAAGIEPAARTVARLAELVGYLHRQGVVHGNLKPANVLLAADGIPRVADFRPTGGLGHGPLPAADADPAGLAYLSPELVPGADPRPHTDIYGLGVILYELLTGRPPFDGLTAGAVLADVTDREPVPPGRLNPAVPAELDWICLRCLRKNPWRRFPRAYDVVVRLRQFLGEPDPGRGAKG